MSRIPSEATQLRTARAAITRYQKQVSALESERNAYRVRATKAEQEAAEWRNRFDALPQCNITARSSRTAEGYDPTR